jgi:lysozyme family protein
MILVERGNLLPTVAVVQYLLNNRLGSSLSIDGDYGAKTRLAVKNFQFKKRMTQNGIVGPRTLRAVSAGARLVVQDHVDAVDGYHSSPGYTGYQGRWPSREAGVVSHTSTQTQSHCFLSTGRTSPVTSSRCIESSPRLDPSNRMAAISLGKFMTTVGGCRAVGSV